MVTSKWMAPAIALAAPMLMAPTCVGNEAGFQEPVKDTYCAEDVRIRAHVSSRAAANVYPSAILGLLDTRKGTALILERTSISPGESNTFEVVLSWEELAHHRGKVFTLVADVGIVDPKKTTPGETISIGTYNSALDYSTIALFARATRSFKVCD